MKDTRVQAHETGDYAAQRGRKFSWETMGYRLCPNTAPRPISIAWRPNASKSASCTFQQAIAVSLTLILISYKVVVSFAGSRVEAVLSNSKKHFLCCQLIKRCISMIQFHRSSLHLQHFGWAPVILVQATASATATATAKFSSLLFSAGEEESSGPLGSDLGPVLPNF